MYSLHNNNNHQRKYQNRHRSLPPPAPSPPSSQAISNRDQRHSWSRKPQLQEIPEEYYHYQRRQQQQQKKQVVKEDEPLLETTQYILNEIKLLGDDVIEAEARADKFQRHYHETLEELDALKLIYENTLQRFEEYKEREQVKHQYYQELLQHYQEQQKLQQQKFQERERRNHSLPYYSHVSSSSTLSNHAPTKLSKALGWFTVLDFVQHGKVNSPEQLIVRIADSLMIVMVFTISIFMGTSHITLTNEFISLRSISTLTR
ncbi:hypothetical protein BDA99DRAFT_533425 [Phascolomyces articulosus]|uniref:Uncharacterized protein n=1 Tax=Phascolomyces articulosus TaxID=60185 RepID=A0AAD5PIS8_9FUNG|nr:hypothetical protein BDA99DRAFT_533425 [Phascolomyces articulosus]